MSAWERYIHEDTPDRLVQLAVLHAEFEALHPFLDGNGRLGRMLVPLFLWQHSLIRAPMFYISAYFEARRDSYYDGLLAVSRDDDWTGWCRFFLEAVRAQAEENLAKTQGIPQSLRHHEASRRECHRLPIRHSRLGLDLPVADLPQFPLCGAVRYSEQHGPSGLARAGPGGDLGDDRGKARTPAGCSYVSGPSSHRGGRGRSR